MRLRGDDVKRDELLPLLAGLRSSKEFELQQEGARNGLLEVYKIADKVDINWFIVSFSEYQQFANKVLRGDIGDGFYFYGSPITIIEFFTDG